MVKLFGKTPVWSKWGRPLCLSLAVLLSLQCNKTPGVGSKEANLLVVHTAQNRPPLYIGVPGTGGKPYSSLLDSAISYGSVTGRPDSAHPWLFYAKYNKVAVGVKGLGVLTEGGDTLSQGNTTFNFGRYYTMFLFDDSVAKKDSIPLFILPDNIVYSVDTFAFVRYLNFCPGNTYYDIQLTSLRPQANITGPIRDTLNSGFLNFLGNSEQISRYAFRTVHSGSYQAAVYTQQPRDTIAKYGGNRFYNGRILRDSVFLLRDSSYTVFIQGNMDSTGENQLRIRVIDHNKN